MSVRATSSTARSARVALRPMRVDIKQEFHGEQEQSMPLRWYTTVVDCHDVAAQARWWADALGWKVAYESDDEVVIVPSYASDELVRSTPWERIPPGLVFVPVPEGKSVKNRLHIDLAPHTSDDRDAEIDRLLAAGASRADVGQHSEATWTVLADPEGNEFCVLSSRDS